VREIVAMKQSLVCTVHIAIKSNKGIHDIRNDALKLYLSDFIDLSEIVPPIVYLCFFLLKLYVNNVSMYHYTLIFS